MACPRMLAFAQNWAGKSFVFVIIALFAWHAAHRIFHNLHDLGVHNGVVDKVVCYGVALAITSIAGAGLLSLGFWAAALNWRRPRVVAIDAHQSAPRVRAE